MAEWRPASDPPIIPLILIAHEDFVRTQSFTGLSTLPIGSTVVLAFYDGSDLDSAVVDMWPATVDLPTATSSWSVDHEVADDVDASYYRLWLSVPNASDVDNPTIERCLCMGKVTRK